MGRIPLKALTPLPITKTMKKGERNMSRASISAVLAERSTESTRMNEANVVVGTPTEPKAVGVEFTISSPTRVGSGSKPRAMRMLAGMATAVPKPAMPSMKHPKLHPMMMARMRLSLEMPDSIALILSMAPVSRTRLYVKSAAMMTRMMGHSALRTPSSIAVPQSRGAMCLKMKATTAAKAIAMPHALYPGIFRPVSAITNQMIGTKPSKRLTNKFVSTCIPP